MSRPQPDDWQARLRAMLGPDGYTPDETPDAPEAPEDGDTPVQKAPLRIIYERKGRGGKQATIITGFEIPDDMVAEVAAKLKKRLATGGSARGGEVLIQGDRRDDVRKALADLGFKTKG